MADVVEIPIAPEPELQMPPDPLLEVRRPRKVYRGMWGPREIGALGAGVLTLVGVIVFYVLMVAPGNREVVRNRSEADRLDAERISATTKYGDITTTQDQVTKLLRSADDFETRFLPASTNGLNSLYQRLNGLIQAHGLTNTAGPEYQPLQTVGQTGETEEKSGKERYRSLFPGVYVSTTVEGPYQNLRRFIRDIETGNEFIVVSSVELAPSDSDQKGDRPGAQTVGQSMVVDSAGNIVPAQAPARQRPRGKTHGEVVALRLEMAAYFRRPNFTPMAAEVTQ